MFRFFPFSLALQLLVKVLGGLIVTFFFFFFSRSLHGCRHASHSALIVWPRVRAHARLCRRLLRCRLLLPRVRARSHFGGLLLLVVAPAFRDAVVNGGDDCLLLAFLGGCESPRITAVPFSFLETEAPRRQGDGASKKESRRTAPDEKERKPRNLR